MAVASRRAALSAFRELINSDPVEARSILRRPIERDGYDLDVALRSFPLHIRRSHLIFVENLGELGQAQSDETGVAHDVQNVRE